MKKRNIVANIIFGVICFVATMVVMAFLASACPDSLCGKWWGILLWFPVLAGGTFGFELGLIWIVRNVKFY